MTEIKKKYNHFSIESDLLKKNFFQKIYNNKEKNTPNSIITQLPIYINQDIKIGSIRDLIKESVIITYKNMQGSSIKLLPIFDTEWKNLKTENFQNILTKAGIFCDITKDNIIYSEKNTNFVRNLFVDLIKSWDIYEDRAINYRSIDKQKTLGNDEIEHQRKKIKQYNIRYFVDTKNISLIVPTTWPETIFVDVALAVHPDDKRYKKLLKNKVIIPIINKAIPIIADESIDPLQGTGIIRITPTHDSQSLQIAKKHGLTKDKFAIDKKGYFTKYAGDFQHKEAKAFIKNIIKNLDDIHNMESILYKEEDIVIYKKTGERAWPLLCNQLFLKGEKSTIAIQEDIQEKNIKILPDEYEESIQKTIQTIHSWPVTKEDSKWFALPLWKSKNGKNYFISDKEILQLPTKQTKNKLMVLSLIIFNLIVEKRLRQHFSIEECIDILLSKSRTGEQTTLETYIDIFKETLPKWYTKELHELKKIVEYTEKDINPNKGKSINVFEKFSVALHEFLERSVAIYTKRKGFYSFNIDAIANDIWLTQQKEKIEETLGNAMILTQTLQIYNKKKKETNNSIYIHEQNIFELCKTIMIGHNIQRKNILNTCHINKDQKIHKKEYHSFKEMTKIFGIDCTRLYAIQPEQTIEEYEHFINKLRNASRFIQQHLYEKKGSKKTHIFEQLASSLEKKKDTLSEFEHWIIYKTTEIQKEYEELLHKDKISEIQDKIITIIKHDFCDKYLEIQKNYETENKHKVNLWCLWSLLKLLHPFTPFITQHIWDFLWLEWPIITQPIQNEFTSITKNYKTQLFMDIIDRFLAIKEKNGYAKHEEINICFFAPLDFLQYLRKQEEILYKIINIWNIEYLENEKELNNYETETIINITIGIRKHTKEIVNNKKENLQEKLLIKEQELQNIRSILLWLSTNNNDPEIHKQKKKEMIKIKKEIEDIQYHIQKEKH